MMGHPTMEYTQCPCVTVRTAAVRGMSVLSEELLLSSWVCVAWGPAPPHTHIQPPEASRPQSLSSDAFSLDPKLKYLADSQGHFVIHFGTFASYKAFKLKAWHQMKQMSESCFCVHKLAQGSRAL